MIELLMSLPPMAVIMIIVVTISSLISLIASIVKLVDSGIKYYKKTKRSGYVEAEKKHEISSEHRNFDDRLTKVEKAIVALSAAIEKQQQLLDKLTESDMLDIKAWIKTQHDKYTKRGWIDSQALDLLESRFKIYQDEGGNSWALRLVTDLRKLPLEQQIETEVVPVKYICHNQEDNK